MVMVTLAYPRECNLNRLSGAVLTHTFLFVLCRYSAQPVSILQCLPADDCGHCDVHRWGLCHSSLQFAQVRFVWLFTMIRGGADKSLARPGRKKATATKLRIYSTYSPRSSIHFLARCSISCKPLKKKIQKVVLPTRPPRQQWRPRRTKTATCQLFFQSREEVVVRRG